MLRTEVVVSIFAMLIISAMPCGAEEEPEPLDIEFLEWLGQVAVVEDLGVNINELLDAQEKKAQSESDGDNSE